MSDLLTPKDQPLLPLAKALTEHTNTLCAGINEGSADIYEMVTPTTAELLRWWFLEDICQTRKWNFHAGQQQAILNTIVAHEVLATTSLRELYAKVSPESLLHGSFLSNLNQAKNQHPKYCMKMATGTGKTWVLQALLIWQVLNANAMKQDGVNDPRFSRHFLVVAPGLIVYERLLDAFCGKSIGQDRDFESSDVKKYAELFLPPEHRETMFGFVRGNICRKEEIGLKTTGNGLLAITNWHLLAESADETSNTEMLTPGYTPPAHQVVAEVLPLTPGKATGNSLEMLDRRFARGDVLDFLADLPELMVFNDEAHHIHAVKREGELTEVEWQKSLMHIAEKKKQRFVQVDFTATPYNDVGTGKNKHKVYFDHIVVDFDLKQAMQAGLVKSLVLDKRKKLGALPLEFTAERDENGNPTLSKGQRVMLSAGLAKLQKLEKDFAALDPHRHPKMMVMCEDTTITPLVAQFFIDKRIAEAGLIVVDSGTKAELGEKEWAPLREKLFDIDRHKTPSIIISVLMLREGFDVNNVCVIVPLRASKAQILLEQTIGRGLRLMWRDDEYEESRRDNRSRIAAGREPTSLIDVLSIIEHPAFQSFYDTLMEDGLIGSTDGDPAGGSTGDLISVGLREGYAAFDFAIPFIMQDAEEGFIHHAPKPDQLKPFKDMPLAELKKLLGKGDVFVSHDVQTQTTFGAYRVDGLVMHALGFNDYLAKLTQRISQSLAAPLSKNPKVASHQANPYWQVNTAELAGWLEDYIREHLFTETFEPLEEENWRVLLLTPVLEHIIRVFSNILLANQEKPMVGAIDMKWRMLSEVDKLIMREANSLIVNKCIYERLAYPARNGGLEKAFIEWASRDSSVDAFCKISETRHDFLRLRYVKEDGLAAFYSPDFLVRCQQNIYLVETKAQHMKENPNVQRKLKAAHLWCSRINDLPEQDRKNLSWHYVLLGENTFDDYQIQGAAMSELLASAKVIKAYANTPLPIDG